ncbi:hypothetical protein F5144DRAFT_184641 [Chaetomium tenue]|uniref:Uncharacterized protein n=1 Tax=Chaetomium tenue TaxID=1854479 RepID=A0ACB7PCK8_9PEZI|nr:hypothetical protein F5144DRAFT_184641 [Chaetomium globosum]
MVASDAGPDLIRADRSEVFRPQATSKVELESKKVETNGKAGEPAGRALIGHVCIGVPNSADGGLTKTTCRLLQRPGSWRNAVAFGCNQGSDQNLYCNDQPHVLAAAFRQIWSTGEDLMLKAWYSRKKDDAAEYPKFEKRRPKSRL